MKNHFATSSELIKAIRQQTSEVLVSFSRGKDSIATYLRIRDEFERVQPYFYEVVPGLEFVEESLAYYEQKIGCHILRYPAPGFYRALKAMTYQPPSNVKHVLSFDLPDVTHDLLQQAACNDAGMDYETAYNAVGVRSADSIQRRTLVKRNGSANHKRRQFYPIFDWTKQDVIDCIVKAGWKLPVDYRYFSSSFDGIYVKFLLPIKKHFPRDYKRILEFFPLAELEVARFEASGRWA